MQVMSFFELYRMNVPLFAPSVALLTEWEVKHKVMSERIYWSRAPQPAAYPNTTRLSPNTRSSKSALQHWLALSDIYVFPNVTYFDSWEQLLVLLREADLPAISAAMSRANAEMLADLRGTWRKLFMRMFNGHPPGFRTVPSDYATAMRTLYGKGAQAAPSDRACGRWDITECAASQAPCRARASRRAIGRADPSLASGPEYCAPAAV